MSESVTLKSYFYEVLIPSSQKNTSSPIEDILHHVSKYIFYEKACALQMFQSTHPHGVRPFAQITIRASVGFNPRTHTGYDKCYRAIQQEGIKVSIHAPTRGTTLIVKQTTKLKVYVSIHAPTRGTTSGADKSIDIIGSFNPRTHTGYDQPPTGERRNLIRFNPRTHTGYDHMVNVVLFPGNIVSIHAPTRGTTVAEIPFVLVNAILVSIHAPTRGTTAGRRTYRSN